MDACVTVETFARLYIKVKSGRTGIPKIIWTYWNNLEEIPLIAKECIKSWSKHNPDYLVILLHSENIVEFSGKLDPNLAKLSVMTQFGGIWLDATTMCNESFEWIHESEHPFVGSCKTSWTTRPEFPVIENWFFAAPPYFELTKNWLKELSMVDDPITYIEAKKKSGVDTQLIELCVVCISLQTVIQRKKDCVFSVSDLNFLDRKPLARINTIEAITEVVDEATVIAVPKLSAQSSLLVPHISEDASSKESSKDSTE